MDLYGLRFSDFQNIKEAELLQLMKEVKCGHEVSLYDSYRQWVGRMILEGYEPDVLTLIDWSTDYRSERSCSCSGIGGMIADIIFEKEGIDVLAKEGFEPGCKISGFSGEYLGLITDAPWAFNQKTRSLDQKSFDAILRKNVSKITDESFEIQWFFIIDCL